MSYPQISETLRATVGLEQLYGYEVVPGLSNGAGIRVAGRAPRGGQIQLDAQLPDRRAVAVYLHEVGHTIAEHYDLSDAPHGDIHNKYFAVLVAVMYRRAKLLSFLKIYDFAGSSGAGADDVDVSAAELADRFSYIMDRSARLASLDLTIEQIAVTLQSDLAAEYRSGGKQTFCVRSEWIAGVFGTALGIAISASAAAALYLVKYQNPF